MATTVSNQTSYLQNLAKTGTAGEKAWANAQLKDVAKSASTYTSKDFSSPSSTSRGGTVAPPSTAEATRQAQLSAVVSGGVSMIDGKKLTSDGGGWYLDGVKVTDPDKQVLSKVKVDPAYITSLMNGTVNQYMTDTISNASKTSVNPNGTTPATQNIPTPTTKTTKPSPLSSVVGSTAYGEQDIRDLYNELLKGQSDYINAGTNATVSDIEAQKGKLPSVYDALRSQAYATGRVGAIGNNEQLASMGLAGALYDQPMSGYSETSRIAQNVSMQNAINKLTSEQQTAVNDLDQQILKAKASGNAELARIASENKANLMQAIMDKKQVDFEYAQKKQEEAFKTQVDTLGQYYGDFQSEINRRMAIDPNDPLIPYLKMARQDKLASQAEASAEAEQTAYERWLDKEDLRQEDERIAISMYNASKSDSNKNSDTGEFGLSKNKLDEIKNIAEKTADTDIGFSVDVYTDTKNKLIAEALGIDWSEVQRIEMLRKAYPTDKSFADIIQKNMANGTITQEAYDYWQQL